MAIETYKILNERGEKVEPNAFQEFLIRNEWSQYYHHDYWVNEKVIDDKKRQDYTNYGYPTMEAVAYERGWQKALKSVKHED